jgi:hypothetical protein
MCMGEQLSGVSKGGNAHGDMQQRALDPYDRLVNGHIVWITAITLAKNRWVVHVPRLVEKDSF